MIPAPDTYWPRRLAETEPHRLAFKMSATGEIVTFGQLEARANQGARLLRAVGTGVGDHVLLLMDNRHEFLEICFAADRSGIYYTTASTHLTADELKYILDDCAAKVVIFSDAFIDLGRALQAELGGDVELFVVGAAADGFRNWIREAEAMAVDPIADERQGLDMLYSSGTTGRPKGIKWPLNDAKPGAPTMLVQLLTSLFGYDADTRYLCPAPLYHAAPLRHTMVTIKMGGAAFIMARFNAEEALKIIERERVTHSQWVPTMFVRLLKLPEATRRAVDLSSMKMAVHAAAPCPVDVKLKMIEWWGLIIHEYYAGTENNGFTSITTEEWLAHKGSVGRAKLGVIHICDEMGAELPVGREGEIFFENGHRFEYHNDLEKTAACTNRMGWTTLGDIGCVDEEGYLYLTDRKSFVIISGGVNIYPQETEDVLLGHPLVLDAAVIGVPSEDLGEEVKGVVQLVGDTAPSERLEAELIAYCRKRLSAVKCPKTIDFCKALPRTETGKLFKRMLRQEYWAAAGAGNGQS